MGCYLAPDDTSSIERLVRAMEQCPRREALMVVGYMNFNIVDPEGNIIEEAIVEDILDVGLEDMCGHFLLLHTTSPSWGLLIGSNEYDVEATTKYRYICISTEFYCKSVPVGYLTMKFLYFHMLTGINCLSFKMR